MNGGGSNPQADVFAYAAAQVKKAMELTLKLGGVNYGKFLYESDVAMYNNIG